MEDYGGLWRIIGIMEVVVGWKQLALSSLIPHPSSLDY
jgi:hypothetical protein